MTNKVTGDFWCRWMLRATAIIAFLASSVTFLFGAVFTLFAFSPATDMADANILIRQAPPYALGGLLGLVAAVVIWCASRRARIPAYAALLAALTMLVVVAVAAFLSRRIASRDHEHSSFRSPGYFQPPLQRWSSLRPWRPGALHVSTTDSETFVDILGRTLINNAGPTLL